MRHISAREKNCTKQNNINKKIKNVFHIIEFKKFCHIIFLIIFQVQFLLSDNRK